MEPQFQLNNKETTWYISVISLSEIKTHNVMNAVKCEKLSNT